MKVSLAMVSSVDGRTTKGAEAGTDWASPEDQAFFRGLIHDNDAVIMGSGTYESVRSFIRPTEDKPRIILTRAPERYEEDIIVPGLEFSSEEPSVVVERLAKRGIRNVLLAGGAETNARFFEAGLVDEMYLTVEPLVFGEGLPLTSPLQKAAELALLGCERLNEQGTMLLHYRVSTV